MHKYTICTGNSRLADSWPAIEVTFGELYERLKNPIRTSETVAQYRKMSKGRRDEAKDKGGFLMGRLKGTRRKKDEVLSRSGITLDGDKLKPDFIQWYRDNHQYKSIFYTTHSHTSESPRGRIVIPATRDMTPQEAVAIARYLAAWIGINQIDPCSFKVNQMMYWPTCPADGEYVCEAYDGPEFDPDGFLKNYPNWQDVGNLPKTPSEQRIVSEDVKRQEDPLAKEGIVGDWCRAHSISDVMASELAGIYEPTEDEGRYDYVRGEGSSGVVVYDDKFVYSWHATDPASGRLLNAFDLVRIHKFGDDDPKRSFNAMAEYAARDEKVRQESMRRRKEQAVCDFTDETAGDAWKKQLQYMPRSTELRNNLHNLRLILQNDPNLRHIVFNQLADGLEIREEVPWQHPGKFWRDADDAQLICYVEENYGTFSQRNYDIAVTKTADDRSYHPIREYFDRLPDWDGLPRVQTLLIDYLGARDTAYVRAITQKTLCAARRRILWPGIKFDNILVLNGPQGIGKSTLIAKLGMEWYSDSLNLYDMNDKTAAEKLQGYWILEIGELAGMKKADLDKVKAFISRQDDKYRASFGKRVAPHPRQCVFFGTTNSENGYLRDITGNRRYWNTKVSGNGKYRPWDITQDTVDQIWAEVKVLEPEEELFLSPELEEYAKCEQREAMEHDDREGLVREYLDMLLPEDWDGMDIYSRRQYVREPEDPIRPKGTVLRTSVSNIEIWCECFGKPKEDIRFSDSYAISAIMTRIETWEKTGRSERIPIYGKQRIYRRK